MPTPLRSADSQPRDRQFTHFGVLHTGGQSKSSLFTSITVNVILAIIIVILGAAAKKTIDRRNREIVLTVPLAEKPPEPVRPKLIPPKIVPPKPMVKPPEPKVVLPEVKVVEPPKVQPVMQPKPVPIVTPAQPKVVVAAAAPKPVQVNLGKSASVVNNDTHPTAVALGRTDNPIHPSNAPAPAAVDLGNRGMSGMPPGTGGGPNARAVSLGSGQPNGQMGGTGVRAVAGVPHGVPLGTGTAPGGNGVGTQVRQVALGGAPPPLTATPIAARAPVRTAPKVLFKPSPQYTAEAAAMHLEGTVQVRIHVSPTGTVSVLGVTSGLGHGLDEAAVRAAQGIRFKPAADATGEPIDWEGVVSISFQMAS